MHFNNFNASDIPEQDSFEPIPAGWYTAMITDAEEKPTKSGNGSYLQLRIDVINGEFENRVIFERLNLDNPNETAVQIAQRTLASICRAVGIMQPKSSDDLKDTPFMVKVGIQPASGQYEASNSVKGYAPVDGSVAAPAKAQASTPPAQSKPAKAPARKPWE